MQRSVSQTPPRVGGMQPGFVVCFCSEVIFMDLAERLQDLRKKAGYSQEQLADLLGISRQAVSKWEASQGKPEIDNIIKLTEIYHVSADYILLGTEPAAFPAPAKRCPKSTGRRSKPRPSWHRPPASPCCLSRRLRCWPNSSCDHSRKEGAL